MKHHCHAVGCDVDTEPRLLFCARHWRALSPKRKLAIRASYVPGQEQTKLVTGAYYMAQREAVAEVALKDGRWTIEQVDRLRLMWERVERRLNR